MQHLLNQLKLIHKINIAFYISFFLVLLLVIVFYIISQISSTTMQKSYNKQLEIQQCNNDINYNLKRLNYLSIQNALDSKKEYATKSTLAYQKVISTLELLQDDDFFSNNPKTVLTMKHIKSRIIGYKLISNSLKEEIEEGYEDGMYAILALSSTNNIITKELEELRLAIATISKAHTKELNNNIFIINISIILFILCVFFIMVYINHKIVESILNQLNQLNQQISSFFDVLSKDRKEVIYGEYTSNDEISQISKVIDNHIYIAEELLSKEREESQRIEDKVNEKTKEVSELNKELEDTQKEIVFTMGAVAEERSKETGLHVKRVAEYSFVLARLYGLSIEESLLLKNASPMHDIGKIGTPDAILNKPGRHTPEEFEIMKQHAEIGYRMLKHSNKSILKAAAIVAYEHHEKYDGSGYPRKLKGEEIHIYGRITAIADVFDALGSERVYKKAWAIEDILNLLEEEKGKHFDPELVDLFLNNLEHFLAAKVNIEADKDNLKLDTLMVDIHRVENILISN